MKGEGTKPSPEVERARRLVSEDSTQLDIIRDEVILNNAICKAVKR